MKVEGNKRKADAFLTDIRCKFDVEKEKETPGMIIEKAITQ